MRPILRLSIHTCSQDDGIVARLPVWELATNIVVFALGYYWGRIREISAVISFYEDPILLFLSYFTRAQALASKAFSCLRSSRK